MVVKDYYKILELETSHVSLEEIKAAYRLVAKKYHPDVNIGDNLAEARIKDINEAYRTLSTPASKRKYDRMWNAKFGKATKALDGKDQKKQLLTMFLGDVEKPNKKSNKRELKPEKGENIETQINASLNEAFYGAEKVVSFKSIDGAPKTYTIKVPVGIRDGEKIRLIGQGMSGKNGGKNGDLFIKIKIDENSKFKLKGSDIYTDLFLSPWEAALGTKANVDAIDEEVHVYIPQGIQSGEIIKIAGKGYKNSDGTRGDLIAQVKIMVPKKLTKEEKQMFEKLNQISKYNPRNMKN